MTKFEKVSLARYQKDRAEILLREGMSLEEAYQVAEQEYEKIELPRRGTLYSAGYDIRTPAAYRVEPGQNLVIPTGLRIAMEEDMWLGIYIRSSLGFKYQVRLSIGRLRLRLAMLLHRESCRNTIKPMMMSLCRRYERAASGRPIIPE